MGTSVQYGQSPFQYINGLGLSNDATTPNSLLDVAPGNALDSTGVFQLSLPAAVKVSNLVNGLNGLDTGAVAASKVYAVYLVNDPVTLLPAGCMLSLSYTQPLMPYGYSAFLLVGYVVTDASKHFLPGYWTAGNTTARSFTYDAFQATAVTAGASTSYANVDLTKWVPLQNNTPVSVYTNYAPNAAANTLSMQCGNGTGDQVIQTALVVAGTAHMTALNTVLAQTVAISTVNSPTINYKVSSSSDAVAISVAGYQWFV